jgi:hypothetical protein
VLLAAFLPLHCSSLTITWLQFAAPAWLLPSLFDDTSGQELRLIGLRLSSSPQSSVCILPRRRLPPMQTRSGGGSVARLCWRWWCCRAPQVGSHRTKGTNEAHPVLVVLACYRSAPAPTSRPELTGPSLFLPLCFKCMF